MMLCCAKSLHDMPCATSSAAWNDWACSHRFDLQMCRQKVMQEGAEALPARVVIVTGKSRSKEEEAGMAAKEAVMAVLSACRSPFQVAHPHSLLHAAFCPQSKPQIHDAKILDSAPLAHAGQHQASSGPQQHATTA